LTEYDLNKTSDVIEFIEQKVLISSVCLKIRKGRAQILTENSRLMTLAPNRFLHVSKGKLDNSLSRKKMIEKLREISRERNAIAEQINLEHLWNNSNAHGQSVSLSDLAKHIVLPDQNIADDDIEAAIIRRIFRTRCFFKISEKSVYVFTQEEITEAELLKEKQNKEKRLITDMADWLDRCCKNNNVDQPDNADRLINALIADAASLKEQPDKTLLKKVFGQMKTIPKQSSFQILVKAGYFSPDENLHIIRFNYPKSFSVEATEELHTLDTGNTMSSPKRVDLRDLDCFTIDGPTTTDMDDALSLSRLSDGRFQIGIHITDVSSWIQPGSFLDEEARDRGQTLYLPDKIWHMFPNSFSEQTASLRIGMVLPAVSTLIELSSTFEIEKFTIVCSTITVKEKLTYEQVDERINDPDFTLLLKFAKLLRNKRVARGAVIMPRPEVSIDATNPRKLIFRKRLRQTDSQLIVSELMILANGIAAEKAAESGLPFPYRTQQTPSEPIPRSDNEFNPFISYCQRRIMPRAVNSLDPKSHYSLGLAAYTNVTSPLRRYFDVLAQRQLKAAADYEEPYSRSELDFLIHELETSVSRSLAIIHHRNKYWMLKYLNTLLGKSIDAVILDRFPNRYQVWLENICIDGDLQLAFGKKLLPEQRVKVIIEKVSPREELLKLRLDY